MTIKKKRQGVRRVWPSRTKSRRYLLKILKGLPLQIYVNLLEGMELTENF